MKLLTALAITATMFASSASALDPADPAHLQKLKDTNECMRCELSGAKLSGSNLSGATLAGAKLIFANLKGANLKGADLNYAIMQGAILCNTIMPDGSVIFSGC